MYIDDFIKITLNPKAVDELTIEMLGLLSHMRLGDVWSNYLKGDFLAFVIDSCNSKIKNEDIVLEGLGLVANFCASKKTCSVVVNSAILSMLPDLLEEK